MRTIGLSPKLAGAIAAIIVGLVLVIIGERDTGLPVLLAGIGALGIGYAAPPGAVTSPKVGTASDELLPAAATRPPSTRN